MPDFKDPQLALVYETVVEVRDTVKAHIAQCDSRTEDLGARISAAERDIAAREAVTATRQEFNGEVREQHLSCFSTMRPLRDPGVVEQVIRTTQNASRLGGWAAGILGAAITAGLVSAGAGIMYLLARAEAFRAFAGH